MSICNTIRTNLDDFLSRLNKLYEDHVELKQGEPPVDHGPESFCFKEEEENQLLQVG